MDSIVTYKFKDPLMYGKWNGTWHPPIHDVKFGSSKEGLSLDLTSS